MQEFEHYLEEDFIIWNGTLGLRDFVTIGEIDSINHTAYLEEPYEMVGPFCLSELCTKGQISFEACIVMSEDRWNKNRVFFQKEAFEKQRKIEEEFFQDINRYNKRKNQTNEKEHRELLSLPLEGTLEISHIKSAFKKIAKTAHPDVGGSHEFFIKITEARDILINSRK